MEGNKGFKSEVKKLIDKPEELIKLIYKYEKELFDKELSDSERNLAAQYLTRAYFIDLATIAAGKVGKRTPEEFKKLGEKEPEELTQKEKQAIADYINAGRKILIENARYVARAFKEKFDEAIKRLKKRGININKTGQDVANQMVEDIASTVKEVKSTTPAEELLKHPLFTTEIDKLWPGSTICYGTHRLDEKGKEVPAVATTIQSQETAQRTIRESGFIKDTATEYMAKGGNEMGMILFETANPIHDSYKELINSEFGVKIKSLGALVLMMKNEDYIKVMEAFATPELAEKEEYQSALEKFKKICETMRENELADRPTVTHWKDLTINIYLTARARSVAWADCTNAGFEAAEEGYIEILEDGNPLVATNETLEKVDPSIKKLYLGFGFGISLVPEEKK